MRNFRFIAACTSAMLLSAAFLISMVWLFFSGPPEQAAVIYVPVRPVPAAPGGAAGDTGDGAGGGAEPPVTDGPAQEPVRDVLFAGNSLVAGLESVDGDPGHAYICRTGASLPTVIKMVPDGPSHELNVVVMGSNEMGLWSEEKFKASYLELCLKLGGPCACLSVPPVCEAKSRYGERISNANAALYSSWIEELCAEHDGMSYLDCGPFFGDSLDPSMTGDGLHLTGKGYAAWLEWIRAELDIA